MTFRTKEMKGIINTLEEKLKELYSLQDYVKGDEIEWFSQGVYCIEDAIYNFKSLIE